jgi:FkbM family methyltransferase
MEQLRMPARFRDNFELVDRLRYVVWQLTGERSTFQGRFSKGPRISIRPRPAEDFETAYEIFRDGNYQTGLPPADVRRIVDVGGNVGYSCLFWCWRYPHAKVLTFEPHPVHCEILDWHIRVNNYSSRIELIRAGAAPAAGKAFLEDKGIASKVLSSGSGEAEGVVAIELVDFFAAIPEGPIDILKMDIEGAEYDLMSDPRFEQLARRTRWIVMEWHSRHPLHLGGEWCADRLAKLGFSVEHPPSSSSDIGILSARAVETPGDSSRRAG